MDRYYVKIEERPSEHRDLVPVVYSGDRYFNKEGLMYLVVQNPNIVDKWAMTSTKEKVDDEPEEAPPVLNKQSVKLMRINDMTQVNTNNVFMGLYKYDRGGHTLYYRCEKPILIELTDKKKLYAFSYVENGNINLIMDEWSTEDSSSTAKVTSSVSDSESEEASLLEAMGVVLTGSTTKDGGNIKENLSDVEIEGMLSTDLSKLAAAIAAKAAATKKPVPQTMEQARQARIEKAKQLQQERRKIEVEQKAKEIEISPQSTQEPIEKETMDLTSHMEHLKKIQREKNIGEQKAAALARENIKQGLKRTAKQAVLDPQEAPLASPPSPKSPRAPSSPKKQAPSTKEVSTQAPSQAPTAEELPKQGSQSEEEEAKTVAPEKKRTKHKRGLGALTTKTTPRDDTDHLSMGEVLEPRAQSPSIRRGVQVPTLIIQTNPSQEEAWETQQAQQAQIIAQEEIDDLQTQLERVTQERDCNTQESQSLIQDLLDVRGQLTRKEEQFDELLKKEKKMEEHLKYEDARFQKITASYKTVKSTITTLLQNQEPTTADPSTFDSAKMNTLGAPEEILQQEKLQRQLLIFGMMAQTTVNKLKVKELEEQLAQAKAELQIQKETTDRMLQEKRNGYGISSTNKSTHYN
ncbi:hypothetical protein L7F22_060491 [Adiantum nelumboides]|nr:hypothetical protein [Adiantum nelumboides]